MATSVIEICNNALQDLGEDLIVSLSDGTKAANLCNQRWPSVRDAVIRAHPWNCCMEMDSLAPMSQTPAWRWNYQYQLPADCLRVMAVANASGVVVAEWELQGRKLLCDIDAEVLIRYVKRETDPTVYDSLLSEALAARLSAVLAYPLSGSTSAQEAAWTIYQNKVAEARGMDAREGVTETLFTSAWEAAKLGSIRLGTVDTE